MRGSTEGKGESISRGTRKQRREGWKLNCFIVMSIVNWNLKHIRGVPRNNKLGTVH